MAQPTVSQRVHGYFVPPLLSALAGAGHDVAVYDDHSSAVMQRVLDGTVHAGFVLTIRWRRVRPCGWRTWRASAWHCTVSQVRVHS